MINTKLKSMEIERQRKRKENSSEIWNIRKDFYLSLRKNMDINECIFVNQRKRNKYKIIKDVLVNCLV